MNIGEILIWESSNLLMLISVVIGLVIAGALGSGRCSRSGIGFCSSAIHLRKSSHYALAPVRCLALGRGGNWVCP